MKKTKQPGDNISLKTKKTEDPSVMSWINAQTNLMDSLRYLIEHEILQNGVRNLQAFIPMERNVLGSVALPQVRESMREIQEGQQEVSAGKSAKPEEPELPKETSQPRESARPVTNLNHVEDEIADEDIEAWV